MQLSWKQSANRARSCGRLLPVSLLLGFFGVLIGCGGGGGGGGSSATRVTAFGTVLLVDGLPPNTATNVTIGDRTVPVDTTTGGFTFTGANTVPVNVTMLTVTGNTANGSVNRTVTIALTDNSASKAVVLTRKTRAAATDTCGGGNANNDLGTIFISDAGYTAKARGRVIAQETNQPVGGALVNISCVKATTSATDGTFSIATGLPVGLGGTSAPVGLVTATGFEAKSLVPQFTILAPADLPDSGGINDLGDIIIALPVGNVTPLPPYTIKGTVTVAGAATVTASVSLISNGAIIGTTPTDSAGNYSFWVVAGTYTVQATVAGQQKTSNITLNRLDTPVTVPAISF